jgi:hypothetical protein
MSPRRSVSGTGRQRMLVLVTFQVTAIARGSPAVLTVVSRIGPRSEGSRYILHCEDTLAARQKRFSSCALSSIDASRGEAPLARDEEEVERLRHASQELRDAARDSFGRVGRLLEGAQAMLILTDHEGVIVETVGDHRTLEDGRRIHLEVGGVWNEKVVGTNGIGTALWNWRRPGAAGGR